MHVQRSFLHQWKLYLSYHKNYLRIAKSSSRGTQQNDPCLSSITEKTYDAQICHVKYEAQAYRALNQKEHLLQLYLHQEMRDNGPIFHMTIVLPEANPFDV